MSPRRGPTDTGRGSNRFWGCECTCPVACDHSRVQKSNLIDQFLTMWSRRSTREGEFGFTLGESTACLLATSPWMASAASTSLSPSACGVGRPAARGTPGPSGAPGAPGTVRFRPACGLPDGDEGGARSSPCDDSGWGPARRQRRPDDEGDACGRCAVARGDDAPQTGSRGEGDLTSGVSRSDLRS